MRKTTFRAVRVTLGALTVLATLFGPFGGNMTQTLTARAEERPKTASGSITYKGTTTPVVGAYVNAWPFTPGGMGGSGTTDASGVYTITLPASAGAYGMNLGAPAGADWSYNEPPYELSFINDSTVESRTVNFQVTKATATITGTVTRDGAPVTEGNINAWSTNGPGGGGNAQVISGSYTMRVPAGSFNIGFWSPDQTLTAAQTAVVIADGQTITANLIVKAKTAHLTGRIIDGSGTPISGVRMNAFCMAPGAAGVQNGPQPGVNGNFTTLVDGTFDIPMLAGRCNVNVDNFQRPEDAGLPSYVYNGKPLETTLDTDTSSFGFGDITVVKADATILVSVIKEDGTPATGLNGYVFAQKAGEEQFGPGQNFGGPLMFDGKATIKMPSSVFSLVKLGMHLPPEAEYSVAEAPTVSVVANSTSTATLRVQKNNSSIYGALVDQNGIPLSTCTPPAGQFSFGDVFVNSTEKGGRGVQFKSDCSYKVSVVAGTYQFNYHFSDGTGLLNANQGQDKVEVHAGENVVKNITALVGDAKINITVLDPTGAPVQTFVDAGNEIELFGKPGDQGGPNNNGPKDLGGAQFKDKNGKAGDPFEVCMKAYQKKDAKQIKACEGMKLPDISTGPGGCKNVGACVKFCMVPKNQAECGKFKGPEQGSGGQSKPQTGPGGCKTDAECKAYCSKPENQKTCQNFGPPPGEQGGSLTGVSFFKGTVKGESTNTGDRAQGGGPRPEDFKNVLHTGSQTNAKGVGTITLLSGHLYEVHVNAPPGSPWMPAQSQTVDFRGSARTANLTFALRQADAKITGKVVGGGQFGFCHGWEESGNFSGGQAQGGKFEINVTKGVWHIGCDAPSGNDFFRSEEVTIVVDGSQKIITQNFVLAKNSNFRIPNPVSQTTDATQAFSMALEDGTTVVAGASAFATSGNVTITATPTANLMSQADAKPAWYGYDFKAINASTGAEITKFNSSVTITFKYTDKMLEAAGVDESALLPRYFDDTTNTWKTPSNATQDIANNTLTVTSDHFSKWSPTSNGKSKATTAVTVGTGKNKGTFTIGSGKTAKKVTAFAGTALNVSTANLGGTTGQLVFAAPSENLKKGTSSVKVYTTKGKLVKTLTPYGNNGAISLLLSDITKDGKNDLVASQSASKAKIYVYDATKKYKSYSLDSGARSGSTVKVTTLAAQQAGVASLTVLVQTRGKNSLKVYGFSKGKLSPTSLNEGSSRIKIAGTSVSLNILKPAGKVTAGKLSTTSTTAKLTLKGSNFDRSSVVTISGTTTKVKYVNGSQITVTVNGTALTKGKTYTLKIVNPDGGTGTIKVKAT
ncbi:MAG: hypothetical protein Q8O51_00660 [bacterium]|nr:hypothetical protein [bacterium]